MVTYKEELHSNYQKSIQAFVRAYPYITDDTKRMIDTYCRTCAMLLWHSFSVDAETCTECLNEIYTDDRVRKNYSLDQVQTAMERLSERNYSLPVPVFFKDIVNRDQQNGTNFSRKLVSCFGLVFLTFALIDGVIEFKEAKLITEFCESLAKTCDRQRIKPFDGSVNPFDFVNDSNVQEPIVLRTQNPKRPTNTGNQVRQSKQNNHREDLPEKKAGKPMDELNHLIGLAAAKLEIKEISDFVAVQNARKSRGLPISDFSYHLAFTGNPGTGKTTVARLVAQIYKELGILSKGQLVEVTAKDLVAGYVGQTAIKTSEVINKSLGGVLFIDEAYSLLDKAGQGYGQEAIDTLLKEMEDHRDDLAVIVAGYDDLMKQFVESNPGLKSRFNKFIHFEDYTPDEMYEIFISLCRKGKYTITPEAQDIAKQYFKTVCETRADDFANGRTARNFFENILQKQAARIASLNDKTENVLSTITEADVAWCMEDDQPGMEETLEDILSEFNSLVGLDMVKEEISDLVYVMQHQQRRKAQGLKVPSLSLHLVFMGNPGTGKTTVARYVAKIYKALGFLTKGQLIETDRSGLVAGYVGQTAIKTSEVINKASGGVLFIDEAYTLATGAQGDFGQEAIDTLLKAMEDKRDDFAVIVAGYDDLMDDFIHSNPGLESRFTRYIHFADYTPDEMYDIFKMACDRNQYELADDAIDAVKDYFNSVTASEAGNGRGARNFFEKVITQQAKRSAKNHGDTINGLSTITGSDIAAAIRKG